MSTEAISRQSSHDNPLWQPDGARIAASNLEQFRIRAERHTGLSLAGLCRAASLVCRGSRRVLATCTGFLRGYRRAWQYGPTDRGHMRGKILPRGAAQLCRKPVAPQGRWGGHCLSRENKVERRLTWNDLHALVSKLQQSMLSEGVQPGDRVAGMMPNMPEAVALMLAASSIGAVWSSCSPDFWRAGRADRFGQIEPKLLLRLRWLLV